MHFDVGVGFCLLRIVVLFWVEMGLIWNSFNVWFGLVNEEEEKGDDGSVYRNLEKENGQLAVSGKGNWLETPR